MGIVIDGQALPGRERRGRRGRVSPAGDQRLRTIRGLSTPGALESAIGAASVVRSAREAGLRRSGLTAAQVIEAARRGNGRAVEVVAVAAGRIGLALAAIVSVLDPALVILGGGIGRNGDLLLEPIQRELATLAPVQPPVVVSELGEDAELLGAVSMALGVAQERLFARTETKGEIAV